MTAKSAREDRKKYWAEIATLMEQASNVRDIRKVYQIIHQVSGRPSALSDSVCDVNGSFIAENPVKASSGVKTSRTSILIPSPGPLLPRATKSPSSPAYAVSCDPPSEGEVPDAIRRLRNIKAPGEDGIPSEIYKSCVDTLAPWLHEVIVQAWRDEVVPDDWGSGILVPAHKKKDKTRCENYGGLSLIDVAAKISAIVLLRRFKAVCDSRTRPNQAGFRAGRGSMDQIFTLRLFLESRHSYQKPIAICLVDFAAAFDSKVPVDPTRHFYRHKDTQIPCVCPVCLYGCECWATRIEDELKLEAFDDHCLRTSLRVKYTDFASNETVRNCCANVARISQAIQERRLRWFGHVHDWDRGILVLVSKTGNETKCERYRRLCEENAHDRIRHLHRHEELRVPCIRQQYIFSIPSEILKGWILSLILFKYAVAWILGKALHEGGDTELVHGRRLIDFKTGNAHGTDHVLVGTHLKVHFSSATKMPSTIRLDVTKIFNPQLHTL
ncbi:unnamed protein product [Schistocephalus solidus]|uniref:Reverse transcriptase domain-containing protein n=1 Tax=Schistocephalus solidus TaxID=70667 RepID=A0A183SIQ1_SCHSO|nr:unnamed protein product [Schistocephalus solidus]